MKKIEKLKTFDNKEFNTIKEAEKHLENLIGNGLHRIANKIASVTRIMDIVNILENNIDELAKIKNIKDNIQIEKDDDEWE